jgi:hypothetical protein
MIQKMLVESWDGRSKIFAELDVVKKITEEKVIVHLWGNNYKEFTLNPQNSVWQITREDVAYMKE